MRISKKKLQPNEKQKPQQRQQQQQEQEQEQEESYTVTTMVSKKTIVKGSSSYICWDDSLNDSSFNIIKLFLILLLWLSFLFNSKSITATCSGRSYHIFVDGAFRSFVPSKHNTFIKCRKYQKNRVLFPNTAVVVKSSISSISVLSSWQKQLYQQHRLQTTQQFCHFYHHRQDMTNLWSLFARNQRSDSGNSNSDEETDDDDNIYIPKKPGMERAFQELEKLESLIAPEEEEDISTILNNPGIDPMTMMIIDDYDGDDIASKNGVDGKQNDSTSNELNKNYTAAKTFRMKVIDETPVLTLEQEIETYKSMVQELEENEIASTYNELMNDLGSISSSSITTRLPMITNENKNDIYTDVLLDLGGTPKSKDNQQSQLETTKSYPNGTSSTPTSGKAKERMKTKFSTTEEFLNAAVEEAMAEVEAMSVKAKSSPNNINSNTSVLSSSSILNDKEIMKEIEDIWNQGNEKLLASLQEIRKEQEELIKANYDAQQQQQQQKYIATSTTVTNDTDTDANANVDVDTDDDESKRQQQRLLNAQDQMSTLLKRVDIETVNVQNAMSELRAANIQIDNNPLYKLKIQQKQNHNQFNNSQVSGVDSGNVDGNVIDGGIVIGILRQVTLIGFVLFTIRSMADSVVAISSNNELFLFTAILQGIIAMICAVLYKFVFK